MGLVKFSNEKQILSSIILEKNRRDFYNTLNLIKYSMKTTFIGEALDFTRLKQFL